MRFIIIRAFIKFSLTASFHIFICILCYEICTLMYIQSPIDLSIITSTVSIHICIKNCSVSFTQRYEFGLWYSAGPRAIFKMQSSRCFFYLGTFQFQRFYILIEREEGLPEFFREKKKRKKNIVFKFLILYSVHVKYFRFPFY